MLMRKALGKGIGALIPSAPARRQPAPEVREDDEPAATGNIQQVPVDAIDLNPRQPRTRFDEEAITELAASIKDRGVLQPILLRAGAAGRYELIAGERRLRAS